MGDHHLMDYSHGSSMSILKSFISLETIFKYSCMVILDSLITELMARIEMLENEIED
jgi:hypothetical protein